MERSFVIKGDLPARLFLPEEFSLKGQSVEVKSSHGVQFKITAADEKQVGKAEASLRTTAAVYTKMCEVAHGN